MVVLKELIFNSFYFGRVWWSCKELIFNSFLLWEGVVVMVLLLWGGKVVLKELIFNSFLFGRVWWS